MFTKCIWNVFRIGKLTFHSLNRCTNYYECENFSPTSKVCGGGLYFNQQAKTCDWPASVDTSVCSGRASNSGTHSGNGGSPAMNIQNSKHISEFSL